MSETEGRIVTENVEAWGAAGAIRREFLSALASAETPPDGTGRFLAVALCKDSSVTSSVEGNRLASRWLGVTHTGHRLSDLSPARSATDSRALVIALVQVLAGYEAHLAAYSWRGDGTTNGTGRYLRFLETVGHPLSEIEQLAASKNSA